MVAMVGLLVPLLHLIVMPLVRRKLTGHQATAREIPVFRIHLGTSKRSCQVQP